MPIHFDTLRPSMNWIDFLEKKWGRLAIPGLIRMIVALNALVYLLHLINPLFFSYLQLNPALILQGELWRLVTFIFIPQFGGILPDFLSLALYLWFLWLIGEGVEQAMGTFRLNLYYLIGMIGTTVAALIFGGIFSSVMLNLSLFFVFARFYPDTEFYLFFVIPVKVKWLAWFYAFSLLVLAPMMLSGHQIAYYSSVAITFANYLLFFGPEIWREARTRTTVAQRRQRFEKAGIPASESLHCCAVCHRTEQSHPWLDFRVGKDGLDYCQEHLKTD